MKLVIMRHGEAAPAAFPLSVDSDAERALTAHGVDQVILGSQSLIDCLAQSSRADAHPFIKIIPSSFLRAKQTAALLSEQLELSRYADHYQILSDSFEITPSAKPERFLVQLDAVLKAEHRRGNLDNLVVILCSHLPFVDRCCRYLLGTDDSRINFEQTASWLCLEGIWAANSSMTIETVFYPDR